MGHNIMTWRATWYTCRSIFSGLPLCSSLLSPHVQLLLACAKRARNIPVPRDDTKRIYTMGLLVNKSYSLTVYIFISCKIEADETHGYPDINQCVASDRSPDHQCKGQFIRDSKLDSYIHIKHRLNTNVVVITFMLCSCMSVALLIWYVSVLYVTL